MTVQKAACAALAVMAVAALVSRDTWRGDSAIAHEGGYEIRSMVDGGGALAVTGPDEPIVVDLIFCSGGECLYENAETSFHTPEDDVLSPASFALTPGTAVAIEIVSIDEGVSIKVGDTKLEQPGDTANLGTAPTLHADPLVQVNAGQGETGQWNLAFRIKTTSAAYAASDPVAMVLTNAPSLCGDGHVDEDEACDAGEAPWASGRACTDDCHWLACGDPDGDGAARASDALFVLAAAVGVHLCDACVCDVDASGAGAPVSGVDALRVLSAAIGLGSGSLQCPPCE